MVGEVWVYNHPPYPRRFLLITKVITYDASNSMVEYLAYSLISQKNKSLFSFAGNPPLFCIPLEKYVAHVEKYGHQE